MDADTVAELLDEIAHDATFRSWVESDPVAALASKGITITKDDVPTGGVSLPTNADILAHLVTLSQQVMGGCATHIHFMLQLGG